MNPLIVSALFGVVTVLTVVSAQQESCGCAAQPTVIQLTCGGGGSGGHVMPPPPPPGWGAPAPGGWGVPSPPAGWPAPPASAPVPEDPWNNHEPTNPEEVMRMCEFDENGYPIHHPPGGFPEGFRMGKDEFGNPYPIFPPGYEFPSPPENWDGSPETIGFEIPQPGTPLYNMLICSPIPVITTG